ncbi:hypothetical protein G6F35_013963 [Rhizopus arrhizus]|nr:hypothetical protein G6F35_013963 [Rhizopus arrhizus]
MPNAPAKPTTTWVGHLADARLDVAGADVDGNRRAHARLAVRAGGRARHGGQHAQVARLDGDVARRHLGRVAQHRDVGVVRHSHGGGTRHRHALLPLGPGHAGGNRHRDAGPASRQRQVGGNGQFAHRHHLGAGFAAQHVHAVGAGHAHVGLGRVRLRQRRRTRQRQRVGVVQRGNRRVTANLDDHARRVDIGLGKVADHVDSHRARNRHACLRRLAAGGRAACAGCRRARVLRQLAHLAADRVQHAADIRAGQA